MRTQHSDGRAHLVAYGLSSEPSKRKAHVLPPCPVHTHLQSLGRCLLGVHTDQESMHHMSESHVSCGCVLLSRDGSGVRQGGTDRAAGHEGWDSSNACMGSKARLGALIERC
jgi:hypothetical protein